MKQAMYIIQIAISLLLMTAILLQAKGTGLGRTFGGVGEFYHSKRGIEKMLFKLTIILAIIFLAVSMASAMI
jgi:preprotein translocase subunit SecG